MSTQAETRNAREMAFTEEMGKQITQGFLSPLERMQNFPLYVPRQDLTKYLARWELFRKVLHHQGSIVECGCLRGGGVLAWAQYSAILEPFNHARRVIGFDTFAGFPAIGAEDAGAPCAERREGGMAADSEAEILACAALHDLNRPVGHIPKIELVRGDACETIHAWIGKNQHAQVALLWLDFDLYEPTEVALANFLAGGRMHSGAIVAFDELGLAEWPGEARAFREFQHYLGPLRRLPWGPTTCWARVK